MIEVLQKYKFPVSPILEYSIKEKIEQLSAIDDSPNIELKDEHQEKKRQIITDTGSSTKKKPSILRVYREDNSIFDLGIAAYTFCETIKEIGIEKVYGLKIPLDGMFLVNKGANPQYPSAQHDVGNGFFVNVHSNTATKKRQLERIFNTLGINWKVKIIESE